MSQTAHGYPLFSASGVRALDRCAIDKHGIDGYELMTRAGAAAFAHLRERWPAAGRVVVVAGGGNNGGDGYVIGRLARDQGMQVEVIALTDPDRLNGDAARAAADYRSAGGRLTTKCHQIANCIIVDALLGTGLDRPVEGRYAEAIDWINQTSCPVLAVDIPSGIDANSGAVLGCAVRAGCTVSFIGRKCGLYTGEAPAHVGELVYESLGVPDTVLDSESPVAWLMRDAMRAALLPPRSRTQHKGHHGHVLVIGGNLGMAGAVRMAGEAALRVGAGLVSVATRPEHAPALVCGRPELMLHGIAAPGSLQPLLDRADVIAIGPGLGRCDWSRGLLDQALETDLPLILDADALNLLDRRHAGRGSMILTPHPGEAARLLDQDSASVQSQRFDAVNQLAEQFGAVTVLKGAGTLVQATGEAPWVCGAGNPGMGSAGMGDVLTGVVAGLRAQGLADEAAARLGVWLHARAGDVAAAKGERGLIASDLMGPLRRLANPSVPNS